MKISKEDWKEIQRASEAGCEDQQLSEDFGISKLAIRQRRFREGWLTPNKIRAEVAAQKARAEALKLGNKAVVENDDEESGVTRVTAEQSIASKMLNSAELIGSQIMGVLVRKAKLVAENPGLIDDPETVADLGTIVNVSRKIAGLDKPDVNANVALNFGAFWEAPVVDGSKVVEAERPRVLGV